MGLSPLQVPRVGVPDVIPRAQGDAGFVRSLLMIGCGTWGGSLWQDHVSASPTNLDVALLLIVMKELFC